MPLPIELLDWIAFLACTDGGSTGCSLSQVSRYVRCATQRHRYRSVALLGKDKVLSFHRTAADLETKPLVRHLFIAELITSLETNELHDTLALEKAISAIITPAAPVLLTLTIHLPPDLFDTIRPFTSALPRLINLACPPLKNHHIGGSCRQNPIFPALRRLHIVPYRSTPGRGFWDLLASSAPLLCHLRLTSFTHANHLWIFFSALLKVPTPAALHRWEELVEIAANLPKLRNIYVQPDKYIHRPLAINGVRFGCGRSVGVHAETLFGLKVLAQRTGRRQGPGKLYYIPIREVAYSADEAREDWLDAIAGGNGAWMRQPPPPPVGGRS